MERVRFGGIDAKVFLENHQECERQWDGHGVHRIAGDSDIGRTLKD